MQAAIVAAEHDAQAAVRWVRANAASLRVDPNRIAVGGGSAGAITAVNVAQRSEDPGSVGGNLYVPLLGLRRRGDVGLPILPRGHRQRRRTPAPAPSELDPLVPFDCVTETETLTRAAGVEVGTAYYYGEGTHALGLYSKYRTRGRRAVGGIPDRTPGALTPAPGAGDPPRRSRTSSSRSHEPDVTSFRPDACCRQAFTQSAPDRLTVDPDHEGAGP